MLCRADRVSKRDQLSEILCFGGKFQICLNPRNPGYILQRQTLGWIPPPINNNFQAVLGLFFYIILEIYINKEPMQKIGSPAFIFWSGGPLELSYLEPV